MTKLINNCTHHTIDENGIVMNTKTNYKKAQWLGANGYYHVDIHEHGTAQKIAVHRLLALHFLPNPENKRTVNHIDGNKQNNTLSNLEWATDSENLQHAHDTGLQPYRRNYSLADYETFLTARFLTGETITAMAKTLNQSLTQLSLHLREAAVRLQLVDKYTAMLKTQKLHRAQEAGTKRRKQITLNMHDVQTHQVLQVFSNVSEARDFLNVKSCGPISNVLSGRQKTAYGYFWSQS